MNEHLPGMDDERMQESMRIAELLSRYLQDTITLSERDELEQWRNKSEKNGRLFDELTDEANIEKAMKWFRKLDTEKALEKAKSGIGFNEKKKTFSLRTLLVAASIIGVIAITALVFFKMTGRNTLGELSRAVKASDVAPGGNKATLKLGDGSVITLDNRQAGLLANENGINIIKSAEGELAYHRTDSTHPVAEFNVLSTPVGGQYVVLLPDGSRAWLNASSSLRYPVSFTGNERKVIASGEVYFEVKKDKSVFIVESGGNSIKVLGTHFNLSAYNGEEFVTTLLEGSIRLNTDSDSITLKPGEQALVNRIIKVTVADHPEDAIAWKNGFFQFTHMGIHDIMKQLSRWYDVEVVYESGVTNASFTATANRNDNASVILKRLEKAGGIHFSIEGKTIIVRP